MYIGFYSYHTFYNKNRLLNDPSSPIGDDLMYPFFLLGKKLEALGHKVSTVDMDDISKFDAIVFIEFPGRNNKFFKQCLKNKKQNLYLLISESPVIKPDNLDKNNHNYFKKIFSWADDIIDNPSTNSGQVKKYFKVNYGNKIPGNPDFNIKDKTNLCVAISSNKFKKDKNELYSERIKAIRWFEKNHPENFDLYGKGWDRYNFEGKILGFNIARLNRLKFLTKLLRPHYPSYKGPVKSKKETFSKYKFSICYENSGGFNGYITEKIFDSLFAGCVPIYLGSPNIEKHIPSNAFIDKRNFKTYEELYNHIKNMPDQEYINYLENIKNFLESDRAYPFSAECFANILIKEITN